MSKRCILFLLMAIAGATQIACAPLAAGVVGAAIGHEIAEDEAEDERERN